MDWSYIAGYFDGEGHVGFHLATRRGKKTRYTCYLQWTNTHLESLQAIRDFLGTGRIRAKEKTPAGHLQCYNLFVTGKANLLPMLEQLIPCLIIKREQAEKLRDYLTEHVKDKPEGWGKAAAVSVEQLNQWYHVEGKTFAEIAAIFGIQPSSVTRMFRVRGLKARAPGAREGKKQGPRSEEGRRNLREAVQRKWREDPEFVAAQRARLLLGHKAPRKPR